MSHNAGNQESIRLRQVDYARALLPEYARRLPWTRAEIAAEQNRALRTLLAVAYSRSPFHRRRLEHLDLDHITGADLSAIPVMTKDDLMEHWDEIVTDRRCTLEAASAHLATATLETAYWLDEYHVIASGGASGRRGVFVYDWHGWTAFYLGTLRGLMAAMRSVAPNPLRPFVSVTGDIASHASSAITYTFSDPHLPKFSMPASLPLDEIVARLNRLDPGLLHGYPSVLPALCEVARSGRLHISPALVWCTSEPLSTDVRAAAAATWGVPVLNSWAASETSGTFPCIGMSGGHISEDLNVIELVDEAGAPVPHGQRSATILVTNLYNHVLPLIRYQITDEFQILPRPCSCGSSYLRIADVQGRHDDIFKYPNSVRIHPLNFTSLFARESRVLDYQVRQTPDGVDVDVTASQPVDLADLTRALERTLASAGLLDPRVLVRAVGALSREASGKVKRFMPMPDPPSRGT